MLRASLLPAGRAGSSRHLFKVTREMVNLRPFAGAIVRLKKFGAPVRLVPCGFCSVDLLNLAHGPETRIKEK